MFKNKKESIIFYVISAILLICIALLIIANFTVAPFITSVTQTESIRYEGKVVVNVNIDNYFYKINKDTFCYLSSDGTIPKIDDKGWKKADNGYCNFIIENGIYNVYVKDSYGNVSTVDKQNIDLNKILNVTTNKKNMYFYLGREEKITYDIKAVGSKEKKVTFKSENDSIATVSSTGLVTGVGYGETNIDLMVEDDCVGKVKIFVSKFIAKPDINHTKDYISCGMFTADDNKLINAILEDRINDAGYQTRAAVVTAARFLALEFNYRVHYFWENGRLNNFDPYVHVDGEGRFYHKGLYLNPYRFDEIEASLNGPVTWGCPLLNYTTWSNSQYSWVAGEKYPNGFDCSGFVTWVLYNAGFDVGDIGAGIDDEHYDLSDLGNRQTITYDLMNSGKVKVGDLIGNNGHAAVLAGWDDNYYYIAESLNTTGGVVITPVKRENLVGKSIYTFIILMDDVYKNDGSYTNMW